MSREDPGARTYAFSRGRPSSLIFQKAGTMSAHPGERYDFWVETQLRHIRMAHADERQRRDFHAQVVSLACANNEMHYSCSDGFQGRRLLADVHSRATDELSLHYLIEGRYDGCIEDRQVSARSGEFFLYDPALPQSLRLSDHRILQVDLSRRALSALFDGRPPAPWVLHDALRRSPLTTLLRNHLEQFPHLAPTLSHAEQQALLRATESFTLEILRGACTGHMSNTDDRPGALFQAARHYIESRLAQPNLGPEQIAAFLGCSRASLYRLFRTHGHGVSSYIRELRLERFRRLLTDPGDCRPIWAMAQDCGLYDSSNLSALFRRRFGCNPRDYRAQALANRP